MTISPALRRAGDLVDAGLVPRARLGELERVAERYAISITAEMAELIDIDDPRDPIARQFVPDARELRREPTEREDPIGDDAHSPIPGLVHRYSDRVLLKLAHICAVYCRFCFRREMVGPGQPAMMSDEALDAALAYIASHAEIWEVVVSGGDPLVLAPRRLSAFARRLATIDHVKVVRWHSRVPVVAPERVDAELIEAIKAPGKTTYVVIHANHPREVTAAARAALTRLADSGIALLSQSVLLRGVNDSADVLGALMRALVECRVKPYYLHQGDLAPGTAHLRASIDAGRTLMHELRRAYSGLCQPTYVLDIPGGYGKVPIGPDFVLRRGDDLVVRDLNGRPHDYPAIEE